MRALGWIVFAFLAVTIGLYPLLYALLDMSGGLLSSKEDGLLHNPMWRMFFYMHISFSGVALLVGWTQFIMRIRQRRLHIHRIIGKVYVICALIGGLSGLFIAFYATGGWISTAGFGLLALLWIYTTSKAYVSIRQKLIGVHREWMIRSYALALAAVTLRLWLPLAQFGLQLEFIPAYQAISWLSWIPNLLVAELIIRYRRRSDRLVRSASL